MPKQNSQNTIAANTRPEAGVVEVAQAHLDRITSIDGNAMK